MGLPFDLPLHIQQAALFWLQLVIRRRRLLLLLLGCLQRRRHSLNVPMLLQLPAQHYRFQLANPVGPG
jgi:hypothetical protein